MTRLIISSILATYTLSSSAFAGPVTWEFAGEVTSVRDNENLLAGQVTVGSSFSGIFTFETTTGDSCPSSPSSGCYNDSVLDFQGSVGPVLFGAPIESSRIDIVNGDSSLPFDAFHLRAQVMFSNRLSFAIIELIDDEGSVFRNDFLPVAPPMLHEFESAEFLIIITHGKGSPITQIDGTVTTLIPEPNTLLLLGLGAGLIFKRKRL